MRQHRTIQLREHLRRRDNNRCWYCGEVFTDRQKITLEHLIPVSRNGPEEEWNLALAYPECNFFAGDIRLSEKFALRDAIRGRTLHLYRPSRSNYLTRRRNRRYVRAARIAKSLGHKIPPLL